jgi:hypothetical protein
VSELQSFTERLLQKHAMASVPHFAIVRARGDELRVAEDLKLWARDFLIRVLAQDKNLDYDRAATLFDLGHADILWVSAPEEGKDYSATRGELDEFFQFQSWRPLELKNRYVVVEDAHKIGQGLSNKLLKTLEEPAAQTTILFLRPGEGRLLPTIESRAVSWRIPGNNNQGGQRESAPDITSFFESHPNALTPLCISYFSTGEITPLLEAIKKSSAAQTQLLQTLTQWASLTCRDSKTAGELIEHLRWFQQSEEFHNQSAERFLPLLSWARASHRP